MDSRGRALLSLPLNNPATSVGFSAPPKNLNIHAVCLSSLVRHYAIHLHSGMVLKIQRCTADMLNQNLHDKSEDVGKLS